MTTKFLVAALIMAAVAGCTSETPKAPFCKDSGGPTECKDDDPCTIDACDEAARKCTHKPADGTPCDDKNACTENDKCAAGTCSPGIKVDTDDKNPCTDDSCDPAKGLAHVANTADCDDKDACTDKDACKDSKCVGGAAKKCDDGNPCTIDECDKAAGCTAKSSTDTCDDKDACTVSDTCKDGKCKGTTKDCDDKLPCTADTCDPATGCKYSNTTGPCDADNDQCTVADACKDGKCVAGGKKDCDDSNPCTENDKCDPTNGKCANKPIDAACNDNNPCTDKDACSGGQCQGGGVVVCDDKNPCTDDSCDPKAGCKTAANTKDCDDGSLCTVGDKCADSVCKPGALQDCPDKDGDSCTAEYCEPKAGCAVKKADDGTACNDGNACTEADKCLAGKCASGTPLKCTDTKMCQDAFCDPKIGCSWKPVTDGATCDDGSKCTDKDTCKGGTCISGTDVKCTDTNFCTDDTCDPKAGCVYAPNKNPCDDKNACTTGDTCKDGACAPGVAKTCNDGKECTVDECNVTTGECGSTNSKTGTPCDDGDKCTAESYCDTAVCVGKTPVTCKDDGNVCTSDACDKLTGCAYPPNTAPCDADGNVCTKDDTCSGGKCVAGQIANCDDKNVCTDDSCDKAKGCLNVANDTALCDDGKVCTVNDACAGGKCSKLTPKNCSDGNSCTDDTCAEPTGCKNTVLLDNSVCDDGDACSTGDACAAGVCKSSGQALWVVKEGTVLADDFRGVTVGPDGTIVSVGSVQTAVGPPSVTVAKMVGHAPDKSLKFDVKALPQGALNRVTTTQGGAYVAVGNNGKAYVVQVNANGKVDWETQPALGGQQNTASDVAALPTGGVVVVGFRRSDNPTNLDGALAVVDAKGVVGLANGYGGEGPYSSYQIFTSVAVAPAGGYWVGAVLSTDNFASNTAQLLRIQASGAIVFTKEFVAVPVSKYQWTTKVVADSDGATIFGGSDYGPFGGHDAWAARVDNGNKLIFENHFGGPFNDQFLDAVPAQDGGYHVVGEFQPLGESVGMVGHLSPLGLLTWQRNLDQPVSHWFSVALTPKGTLALAGQTSFKTQGDIDFLTATCDQFGNCDCASSGTCISKTAADVDDKNPCTLDWCEAGQPKYAIGNEGLTCATGKTCQKGKCL